MDKQEQIRIILDDMKSILGKRIGDISDYSFRFVHERTFHIESTYHVSVIHLSELDKHRMFEHLTDITQDRIETMEKLLSAPKTTKSVTKPLTFHTEPVLLDRLIEQTFEIEL